jgi:hypothetical protein
MMIKDLRLLRDSELMFDPGECQVLRTLAGKVAELAARPVETEKRALWLAHNALRPTRPVVFCDPEVGWTEIILPENQVCQNPMARQWEFQLKREIFWGEQMKDDRVIEPFFTIPHVHRDPNWGVQEQRIETSGEKRTAYTWKPPITAEVDWEQVKAPTLAVDFVATSRLAELARQIFGDLLAVQVRTQWWWTLGMTWTLINLRGLEQFMFDLTERPEFVHRMMTTLRDGTLAMLDELEKSNLLAPNWDGTYVGSGGFGWSDELPNPDFCGMVRPKDMWGFAESQETVGVSPRMFEQFIFPYQLQILERFGLNCYGCCEPLDKRWHIVERIPRLRRVSVSPWSDRRRMAEFLGSRYILSMKPNPADMAGGTLDEDRIRAVLRQGLEITRGCRVEVILKDVTTMINDPRKVVWWVKMAKEEAENL